MSSEIRGRRNAACRRLAFVGVLLAVLAVPSSAGALTIGPASGSSAPGVAVDAAGTAYIAWGGTEDPASLQFCRLPRGATSCDVRRAIAAPGTTGHRAFVVVSGNFVAVVQYRYPNGLTPNDPAGMYSFLSSDRGATFGAGERLGPLPFFEALPGPGATVSGVTAAESGGTAFQNVPFGGSTEEFATLSTDHPYAGTVGLIDAATPLAVFQDGSGGTQFRRYGASGSYNDAANWTAPVDIGVMGTPKLAGGPTGLFLFGTTTTFPYTVFARKWNGTTFAEPVAFGAVEAPLHAFQDAGGRLHAAFSRGRGPIDVVHAVSDNGTAWRSGTVVRQSIADGGIADTRIATAPDHIGVVAWNAGRREIRVAAVGPDAPRKPKPRLVASGFAERARKVHVSLSGRLVLPDGVSKEAGCTGAVKIAIKRGDTVIAERTARVNRKCRIQLDTNVRRSKVKDANTLGITLKFRGNEALRRATKSGSIKVGGN